MSLILFESTLLSRFTAAGGVFYILIVCLKKGKKEEKGKKIVFFFFGSFPEWKNIGEISFVRFTFCMQIQIAKVKHAAWPKSWRRVIIHFLWEIFFWSAISFSVPLPFFLIFPLCFFFIFFLSSWNAHADPFSIINLPFFTAATSFSLFLKKKKVINGNLESFLLWQLNLWLFIVLTYNFSCLYTS